MQLSVSLEDLGMLQWNVAVTVACGLCSWKIQWHKKPTLEPGHCSVSGRYDSLFCNM